MAEDCNRDSRVNPCIRGIKSDLPGQVPFPTAGDGILSLRSRCSNWIGILDRHREMSWRWLRPLRHYRFLDVLVVFLEFRGALHLATIAVMSSCCSRGLNWRTSSTIDATIAFEGWSRWRRRASIRRWSPNSSPAIVERFGYAVGVKRECVSRESMAFVNGAVPCFEKAQHCTRRIEAFEIASRLSRSAGRCPQLA